MLGSLIDSSLVLNDEKTTAINFNDNKPDEKGCVFLKEKFKQIDLAMLDYNAAGPYPSCFDNLSIEEKKSENDRILKRNFDHLCKIIPILRNDRNILRLAESTDTHLEVKDIRLGESISSITASFTLGFIFILFF